MAVVQSQLIHKNPVSEFYVVRKDFKHPEVLPKVVSALSDKLRNEDRNYQPVVDFIKRRR
ncbi:hypothetical protein GCM10020331_075560 [Ectobacillus funiculus]